MLRDCSKCGREFEAKFDWSKECIECFLASPKGKAWKARKDAENNGFNHSENFWDRQEKREEKRQEQERGYHGRFTPNEDKLDKDLLRKLIMLCHPDKHAGSALSNEVTKRLLAMKEKL